MALFPGPPGWAGAIRELLDFMAQGKINTGRHIDHLAGCHSIRTDQCPPPPSPHFFTGRVPAQPTLSKHWRLLITQKENFVSLDVWFLRHVNVQMDRKTDLLIALLHTSTRGEVKILQSKGSAKKHVLSLNNVQSSSGKRFQEAGPEWTWKVRVCLDKNRRNYLEDQSRSLVMALFNNITHH